MSRHFKVGEHVRVGRSGIVYTFVGHPVEHREEWIPLGEDGDGVGYYEIYEQEDDSIAIVVMVGDDRKHEVNMDSLSPHTGPVCSCGQAGCGWHGEDTEEGNDD